MHVFTKNIKKTKFKNMITVKNISFDKLCQTKNIFKNVNIFKEIECFTLNKSSDLGDYIFSFKYL